MPHRNNVKSGASYRRPGGARRHLLLEDRQRHRAEQQNLVEPLHVEARAELGASLVAEAEPDCMTDLIAQRLARPGCVAVDLILATPPGDAGSLEEIVGGLLA